jgi:hypothetical protein
VTCRTPARFSYANYRNARWLRPAPPHNEIRTKIENDDIDLADIVYLGAGRYGRKGT